MADRDYDMSGILFAERQKKSEKAPDYRGKLTMGGTEYELAGWKRLDKNGNTFLSLKVSLPGDRPVRAGDARTTPGPDDGWE